MGKWADICINANRNIGVYEGFGVEVVCDIQPDYAGPLAGMQAALAHTNLPYLVTVPCDVPMFPLNLVEKLSAPFEKNVGLMLTVASTKGRHHPVFCMMRTELLPNMEEFCARVVEKLMPGTPTFHMKRLNLTMSQPFTTSTPSKSSKNLNKNPE